MERDPVCSKEVDPRNAPAKLDFDDHTYYFCSQDCFDQFVRQPELYAVKGSDAAEEVSRLI